MKYMEKIYNGINRSLSARLKTFRTKNRARWKFIYQKYCKLGPPQKHIFIFGCQRSGTTLLERMFRHDFRSAVFGEFSDLSIAIDRTPWKGLPDVQRQFNMCRGASYVVARSLYESDRAMEILNYFTPAVAVWLYRDYRAVVKSMKRKWGGKFFEISERVESNANGVWEFQPVFDDIRNEVHCLVDGEPTIDDYYSLFWLKRNMIVIEKGLLESERFVFLRYSSLVKYPDKYITAILKRAEIDGLWLGFRTDAHTTSIKSNYEVSISNTICEKCDSMLARIDSYHMKL